MQQLTKNKISPPAERVAIRITQGRPATHQDSRRGAKPEYIVVHYTGVANETAKQAMRYFASPAAETSAHFVVDESAVYQVAPLAVKTWHVGNGQPETIYERAVDAERYHASDAGRGLLGNRNSVGIELAVRKSDPASKSVRDRDWTFTDGTLENSARLIAALAELLRIPRARIIRHMDATGKPCPRPFVSLRRDGDDDNDRAWADFLSRIDELRPVVSIEGQIV